MGTGSPSWQHDNAPAMHLAHCEDCRFDFSFVACCLCFGAWVAEAFAVFEGVDGEI